jgi:2-desacetyl-2-hydroxyethyl bacteriochlorophyllide A dehydrogenase
MTQESSRPQGSVPTRSADLDGLSARALWFVASREARLLTEDVPEPSSDQVMVRAIVSLVSSGTELTIYRGEGAADQDLGLETCSGSFGLPVKYAYQVVGEVVRAGDDAGIRPGDLVFARHPHQELFTMRADSALISRIPADLAPERAVFANLLDVALNCQLDVPVRHGDCVAVYGQGTVGSLCAQLARRTAAKLAVIDPIAARRDQAIEWGADAALDPADAESGLRDLTAGRGPDISIEASGSPAALQMAIRTTGQEGTIAAVSFYGTKQVPLVLAPEFHVGRQRIISTQVGAVGSGLQPRWSLQRRFETVFGLLETSWLRTLVSHEFPFDRAPEAYALLDARPESASGVLLRY